MSKELKTYKVSGGNITAVDDELHRLLNIIARRLYSTMGYRCGECFDFSTSEHPQEQGMYMMALEVYALYQDIGFE